MSTTTFPSRLRAAGASPRTPAAGASAAGAERSSEVSEKIKELAELLPVSLGKAIETVNNDLAKLKEDAAKHKKHQDERGRLSDPMLIRPPIRGNHKGVPRPTFLQQLLQVVSMGHYFCEVREAPPFIFSFAWGDWVTAAWHWLIFSTLWTLLTCGSCPRHRRIGNSYVRWDTKTRVLSGTVPSGDELASLKATFSSTALGFVVIVVAAGGAFGVFYAGTPFWSGAIPWSALTVDAILFSIILAAAVYMVLRSLALGFFKKTPRLVGTRNHALPSLLSLITRVKAPHFMISYSWGGDGETSTLRLAHALGEILPDAWIDHRRLVPGQLLVDEMRRPVLHARVMVVLMNPAYANSFNCGHELLATLRYRDPRKGHRTVVLLEEWNEKGFAPKWSKIRKQLLEKELGIDAVCKTVDELLVWLDEHAIHAESAVDADLTLKWFKEYQHGRSDALSSNIDYRLPWNFFIGGGKQPPVSPPAGNKPAPPPLATSSSDSYAVTVQNPMLDPSFQTTPIKRSGLRPSTVAALFNAPTRGVDLTTGSGGVWIPANAMAGPRPHIALSYVSQWLLIVACTIAYLIHFALSVANSECPGGGLQGFLCLLKMLNASIVILFADFFFFVLFTVRWGAVLATTTSQLHSPELLVPLLAQKIHERELSSRSLTFCIRFLVPRKPAGEDEEHSNCQRIAENMCQFLKDAGCASVVADFPEKGKSLFSAEGSASAQHLRSVYVLFLETKEDLEAWIDSQERDLKLPQRVVLVSSQRFLLVHRAELFKWLVIEFAEVGRESVLTTSGTASGLSLASAILGAVSMKLADLLLVGEE